MIRRAMFLPFVVLALTVPTAAQSQDFSTWCSSLSPSLCQSYSGFGGSSQSSSWLSSFLDELIQIYEPILADLNIDLSLYIDRPIVTRPPVSVPEPPAWPMVIPGMLVLGFLALRRRGDRVA